MTASEHPDLAMCRALAAALRVVGLEGTGDIYCGEGGDPDSPARQALDCVLGTAAGTVDPAAVPAQQVKWAIAIAGLVVEKGILSPPKPPVPADGFLYAIRNTNTGVYKFGYTNEPKRRFTTIQTSSPDKLMLLGSVPAARTQEIKMHALLTPHRLHGEWYKLTDVSQMVADGIKGGLAPHSILAMIRLAEAGIPIGV